MIEPNPMMALNPRRREYGLGIQVSDGGFPSHLGEPQPLGGQVLLEVATAVRVSMVVGADYRQVCRAVIAASGPGVDVMHHDRAIRLAADATGAVIGPERIAASVSLGMAARAPCRTAAHWPLSRPRFSNSASDACFSRSTVWPEV